MFVQEIEIPDESIRLISPSPEHAEISLGWVGGIKGRRLLEKMGNNLPEDWVPSLVEEKNRINNFLTKEDEVNWTIEYHGRVVGAVWLSLSKGRLIGPHIMIGDESVYGKGIATNAMHAVCDWALKSKQGTLQRFNFDQLTTRCRVDNQPIIRVNEKLGFEPVGETYEEDGFTWQNYTMKSVKQ